MVGSRVVGHHVGLDHAEDVVAGVVGHVCLGAEEALLLAGERDKTDGVV